MLVPVLVAALLARAVVVTKQAQFDGETKSVSGCRNKIVTEDWQWANNLEIHCE